MNSNTGERVLDKTILLVDDETNILHMLSRALRAKGWSVNLANTPEEALRELNAHEPSVVMTDVRLQGTPTTEGIELLVEVKARNPKTRVIVMTGYGTEDIQQEAREKGADFYFEKPIDIYHLLHQLERLCMSQDGDRGEKP